jgi:hypothetical protein
MLPFEFTVPPVIVPPAVIGPDTVSEDTDIAPELFREVIVLPSFL